MINTYKSRLIEKKEFGSIERELVYILKFEIIEGGVMEYKAGQFVNVMLPGKVARAYSIVQLHIPRPADPLVGHPFLEPRLVVPEGVKGELRQNNIVLELCIEYIPSGIASEFFKKLQIGDEMIFKSPFGRFVLQEEDLIQNRDLLFIGTGTGIVPFVGMVEEVILRGELTSVRKITILHGVPFEELDYYDEYFYSKIEEAKNVGIELKFERWVSRPTEDFVGNRGRVSVHIDAMVLSPNTAAYICGGNEAIQSIREHLIIKGVYEGLIRTERFH